MRKKAAPTETKAKQTRTESYAIQVYLDDELGSWLDDYIATNPERPKKKAIVAAALRDYLQRKHPKD